MIREESPGQEKGTADMIPNQILGIPIIEEAAPGDYVAQVDRQLHSEIQAAIDLLRPARSAAA